MYWVLIIHSAVDLEVRQGIGDGLVDTRANGPKEDGLACQLRPQQGRKVLSSPRPIQLERRVVAIRTVACRWSLDPALGVHIDQIAVFIDEDGLNAGSEFAG